MQALLTILKILGWFLITSTLGVLAFFLFINYGLHPWIGVPYITFVQALAAFALCVIAFYLLILVYGTFTIARQSIAAAFKGTVEGLQEVAKNKVAPAPQTAASASAPAPAAPAPQEAEVVK